ncbi:MAG: signal peptidase I [Lachnospiraceae bacterium]|nr:signal peptidase I [uncultured Acetatifactor sp.]MCI8791083.1 signal peptidase I [Lachnospiraceae bacterium]
MLQDEIIKSLKLLIMQKGFITVPISTDSMSPIIKREDKVKICMLKRPPEIGEIIAYHKFNNHITVHRIYNKVRSGHRELYITKGDNNIKNDPYLISIESIIGVVVEIL